MERSHSLLKKRLYGINSVFFLTFIVPSKCILTLFFQLQFKAENVSLNSHPSSGSNWAPPARNTEYNFKWNQPCLSRVSNLKRCSNSLNYVWNTQTHINKVVTNLYREILISHSIMRFKILVMLFGTSSIFYQWNKSVAKNFCFFFKMWKKCFPVFLLPL